MRVLTSLYRIRAKVCELPDGSRKPIEGLPISLPANTTFIIVHGSFLLRPRGLFESFVRIGDSYWPQHGPYTFEENKTWTAKVTFGNNGLHRIIIAEISPAMKVLVDHYRKVGRELEHENTAKKWIGIDIPERFPDFRPQQEFEVSIG